MVGLARLELATPRLSSVCSNQLSYKPFVNQNRRTVYPTLKLCSSKSQKYISQEISRRQKSFDHYLSLERR